MSPGCPLTVNPQTPPQRRPQTDPATHPRRATTIASPPQPTLVRLADVTVGYAARPVLENLTLDLARGTALAVLGGSGVGKSTLLRVLAGLLEPQSGHVVFADGPRPRQAVALQEPLLYPWLTALENIRLGQRFGTHRDQVAPERVEQLVDALGLRPVLAAYPDEMSGGQAQRVSLARALAGDPELLLLDEPLSALDPAIRSALQRWLRTASREAGRTTVVVTHDIDEALVLADDILLLGAGGATRHWVNVTVDGPAPDGDGSAGTGTGTGTSTGTSTKRASTGRRWPTRWSSTG